MLALNCVKLWARAQGTSGMFRCTCRQCMLRGCFTWSCNAWPEDCFSKACCSSVERRQWCVLPTALSRPCRVSCTCALKPLHLSACVRKKKENLCSIKLESHAVMLCNGCSSVPAAARGCSSSSSSRRSGLCISKEGLDTKKQDTHCKRSNCVYHVCSAHRATAGSSTG